MTDNVITHTDIVDKPFMLDGVEMSGPWSFTCGLDDSIGHLSFADDSLEIVTIRARGMVKLNSDTKEVEFSFQRVF